MITSWLVRVLAVGARCGCSCSRRHEGARDGSVSLVVLWPHPRPPSRPPRACRGSPEACAPGSLQGLLRTGICQRKSRSTNRLPPGQTNNLLRAASQVVRIHASDARRDTIIVL